MAFRERMHSFFRSALMIAISVFVIVVAFRVVGAGVLSPVAAPAGTMKSAADLYDVLVGTYDSSSVVASRQGSALQVTKCIIGKINGSPCP